ncbi:MAG: c-type cytochrome [Myxococcales bacterium]|jgi:mono/diheme cytochrome c family protein
MKLELSIPLAAGLALTACSGGGDKPAPAPEPAKQEQAAKAPAGQEVKEAAKEAAEQVAAQDFDAKQTFNTVCATCHGTSGHGDGPAGKALDPKPASFAEPEFWETRDRDHIIKVVKNGGPSVGKSPLMAAFGAQFSDEQIGEIADYVISEFKPK